MGFTGDGYNCTGSSNEHTLLGIWHVLGDSFSADIVQILMNVLKVEMIVTTIPPHVLTQWEATNVLVWKVMLQVDILSTA